MSPQDESQEPIRNLLDDIPASMPDEIVDTLVDHSNTRVERIISTGHRSPDGFWYDQNEHEWVVVIRGAAVILFEDSDAPIRLGVGDHLHIAAHRRHRVQWTSADEPTVWIAVFYG
tara:strand:+ start:6711 stop:7058 length:348 start_codon:yes stop_codon:yes gene_type:complete